MNNQAGLNTVIQHQMVQINRTSQLSENDFFLKGTEWGEASDFQREGSECSEVNFGHIVPHYRWDLTIS